MAKKPTPPKKTNQPKKTKKARQLARSEVVKNIERAIRGWTIVVPTAPGPATESQADGLLTPDARLPSMKELRIKYLGTSSVKRDALEPPLTDQTGSLDIVSGGLKSRVWVNKATGTPTLKKG